MSANEAEKKFWKSPELVEGLLPFLDPPSILELAKAHPLTAGVMQGTFNWTRFIKRSCPYPPADGMNNVAEVRTIVGILQIMGNPQFHLLALLDIICERFTPAADPFAHGIKVTCPSHKVHNVSPLGFMLLESVEGAINSSEQKVESIELTNIEGPLIQALKYRVTRQESAIRQIETHWFSIQTQNDAEDFLTLAQLTEVFGFRRLFVGPIGEGGWTVLAETLRLLPPLVDDFNQYELDEDGERKRGFQALLVGARNFMLDGRREDVKAIWDALPEGTFLLMRGVKTTADGPLSLKWFRSQEDWMMLVLYLDNEDAFVAHNQF